MNIQHMNNSDDIQKIFQMIHEQKCFRAKVSENPQLIQFDKLRETHYSQTFRGFDQTLEKFVSINNLDLNFPDSWRHLQILLLQFKGEIEEVASCHEILYDKDAQKMTVVRDCNYKLLSDYSQFKLKNEIPWTNNQLLSLSLQLFHQMYNLELAGLCPISLVQPQNLFLTPETHLLKFHNLSDFQQNQSKIKTPEMQLIMSSLIHIINPLISVASHEQALLYFKKNHSEFLSALESLESKLRQIRRSEDRNELFKLIQTHRHHSPKGEMFNEPEFNSFVQNKLKTILAESKRNEPKASETLTSFFLSSDKNTEKGKTLNESVKKNLEISLEAFEKALSMKNQLSSIDKSIIQQLEQECQKIRELLKLNQPSVSNEEADSLKEIKNKKIGTKVVAIFKALALGFWKELNLIPVLKGTFIFSAVYFVGYIVFVGMSEWAAMYFEDKKDLANEKVDENEKK